MNFKTYDILSSLIPGFILLFVMMYFLDIRFNKDLIVEYTVIAFVFGYFLNTLSSWLEDFYYFTWKGKPSNELLNGKNIWKVKFYEVKKVRELLENETLNDSPSNDELFSIAMRYANGEKDSRVDDFNSNYAFSRVIMTTILISTIILLIKNLCDIKYYLIFLPLVISWVRCKQRAYYYSREVLNVYLKIKEKSNTVNKTI